MLSLNHLFVLLPVDTADLPLVAVWFPIVSMMMMLVADDGMDLSTSAKRN